MNTFYEMFGFLLAFLASRNFEPAVYLLNYEVPGDYTHDLAQIYICRWGIAILGLGVASLVALLDEEESYSKLGIACGW